MMAPTIPIHRIRRVAASMSWSTIDQVLSAASNFVVTVAVARGSGVDGLGRFGVAFALYLAVLGFARSLVSEPMLAQARTNGGRSPEPAALTATLLFAIVSAVLLTGVGLALDRPEIIVAGVALPVTLLHDLMRYLAFRRQSARTAAALDGGWLVGSVAMWPIITGFPSPALSLACWAGAAIVGIAAGIWLLRPRLACPRVAYAWWRLDAKGLAAPLLADSVLFTVSGQALIFVLASMVGDAAVGTLRAGQVFFAPIGLVIIALGVLMVPRLAQRATPMTTRLALSISAATTALAFVACLIVVLAEPLLHSLLFGDAVDVSPQLLLALAVQNVVLGAGSGLVIVSKVRRRGGDIARSRLWSTVVGVVLIVVATWFFGLTGALWALVAQAAIYLILLGLRVTRTSSPSPVPTPPVETEADRAL